MLKSRVTCFILIVVTILCGLLSRHIQGIPLFIGDILWGLMIYLMVRWVLISRSKKWVTLISLAFCYAIEFSQLYQAPWINNIRHTLIGGLILGETFLWSDMLCYTVGVGIAVAADRLTQPGKLN